jgi:hypothetical protein
LARQRKEKKWGQERLVTTKRSDEKDGAKRDWGAAVEERRARDNTPDAGERWREKGPGWRWEHDTDVEKKRRRTEVERTRNKNN